MLSAYVQRCSLQVLRLCTFEQGPSTLGLAKACGWCFWCYLAAALPWQAGHTSERMHSSGDFQLVQCSHEAVAPAAVWMLVPECSCRQPICLFTAVFSSGNRVQHVSLAPTPLVPAAAAADARAVAAVHAQGQLGQSQGPHCSSATSSVFCTTWQLPATYKQSTTRCHRLHNCPPLPVRHPCSCGAPIQDRLSNFLDCNTDVLARSACRNAHQIRQLTQQVASSINSLSRQLKQSAKCPEGCATGFCQQDSTSGALRCAKCENNLIVSKLEGWCGEWSSRGGCRCQGLQQPTHLQLKQGQAANQRMEAIRIRR